MESCINISKQVSLSSYSRGCHQITDTILRSIQSDLSSIRIGLLHLFCSHTSCSISIASNSPSYSSYMESTLNTLVPESASYRHSMEGPDDMPAHVKSSLLSTSHAIPISNGRLLLGNNQAIYFCEHRDYARSRKLQLMLQGTS